ncbi:hypothetical protein [Rhodococcus sp. SORGH_AS_0303]|uniref:hypothetical protein n=1 Tax=Rhodococcus sp. SORGH_AS_0303 TaxID=3041753 RepID=UPI00278091EA|nr:hypothetical protein [Rhodococcus sp. SORGH_AS_0303]MDQ1203194.1 hypothetical protein [Rhodococcus sp. SORGH_AS_0303]
MVGDILYLHVTESSQWATRDAQEYGSAFGRDVFGTRVTNVSGPVEVAAVNDETIWAQSKVPPIPPARDRPIV